MLTLVHLRCLIDFRKQDLGIGFLNDLFHDRRYIVREMSIPFLLDENPLLYRSARPGERAVAREVFVMAPLPRTQSERRRRTMYFIFVFFTLDGHLSLPKFMTMLLLSMLRNCFSELKFRPQVGLSAGAYPHLVQDIAHVI